MTDMLPSSAAISAFLLTYFVQSTVSIALVAVLVRQRFCKKPELRVLLWKAALIVPVLTTISATAFELPHFGSQLIISGRSSLEASDGRSKAGDLSSPFDGRQRRTSVSTEVTDASVPDRWEVVTRIKQSLGGILAGMPPTGDSSAWSILAFAWLCGSVCGTIYLCDQAIRLERLRRDGSSVTEPSVRLTVELLATRLGIRRRVQVFMSANRRGPLTGGIVRPFLLVPSLFLPTLRPAERDALFAHELAHVARRDSLWNLISHSICRVFFFQPLNQLARRRLHFEMEFVADSRAAEALNDRTSLARCLASLGEWLSDSSTADPVPPALATGMASFRSTLGQRVETLLAVDLKAQRLSGHVRSAVLTLLTVASITAIAFAPRAVTNSNADHKGNTTMVKQMTTLAVLVGMAMPAVAADDKQTKAETESTTAHELPAGMQKFNGMLVGRVLQKDVEKGTFVVKVDAVPRVWRNSKAEGPKAIIGKNVEIDGVFGRWLDVLLLVKEGETLEFEARHDGGNRLTFPGEALRKVEPVKPGAYPELPEDFRGFRGAVVGKVTKKDAEMLELIIRVEEVRDTWDKNQAKKPESIVGKRLMLAGFWQRRDEYNGLKVGDKIECGLQHHQLRSDHLSVAEYVRKVSGSADSRAVRD